jgi:deoxyribose-phosphate aldolase
MMLTVRDIAEMMDLSCVRTNSTERDVAELVEAAKRYNVRQVSVLQSFIPQVRRMLGGDSGIVIVGNVSFPSGADSTPIKVAQAKEMADAGCGELDVVINVGMLLSGRDAEVEEDLRAVVEAVRPLPVKAIIETPYLGPDEIARACDIGMRAGAAFIKTGTGWGPRGTTMDDVRLIRSRVGDRIRIKASGGIRNVETIAEMYKNGVTRFGINLTSGRNILEQCLQAGGSITL